MSETRKYELVSKRDMKRVAREMLLQSRAVGHDVDGVLSVNETRKIQPWHNVGTVSPKTLAGASKIHWSNVGLHTRVAQHGDGDCYTLCTNVSDIPAIFNKPAWREVFGADVLGAYGPHRWHVETVRDSDGTHNTTARDGARMGARFDSGDRASERGANATAGFGVTFDKDIVGRIKTAYVMLTVHRITAQQAKDIFGIDVTKMNDTATAIESTETNTSMVLDAIANDTVKIESLRAQAATLRTALADKIRHYATCVAQRKPTLASVIRVEINEIENNLLVLLMRDLQPLEQDVKIATRNIPRNSELSRAGNAARAARRMMQHADAKLDNEEREIDFDDPDFDECNDGSRAFEREILKRANERLLARAASGEIDSEIATTLYDSFDTKPNISRRNVKLRYDGNIAGYWTRKAEIEVLLDLAREPYSFEIDRDGNDARKQVSAAYGAGQSIDQNNSDRAGFVRSAIKKHNRKAERAAIKAGAPPLSLREDKTYSLDVAAMRFAG